MAVLHITEFQRVSGPGPLGLMPPLAEQAVTYTTSTQSSALNSNTTVVRLVADADAYIAFGSNPTATANSMLLPAGVVEHLVVEQGSGLEIAAYDGSS